MARPKRHFLPDGGEEAGNISAMDVIFQQCLNAILKTLLIFFILAASLAIPNSVQLKLPESTTGTKATDKQKLEVSYKYSPNDRRETITLNNVVMPSLDQLTAALQKRRPTDPKDITVDISIENTVSYDKVIQVLDAIRDANYYKYSLLALAKTPPQTAMK